jgi:serine/threonine-protein kinase
VLFEMLTGDVPFHGESPVMVAMKHVREDLPDVQRLRPDLAASTAAVLDRATAKDLSHRYADADSMIAALAEVLAIEASRTGQATGEATTVLRTLPGEARRRLPMRMRHPARWALSLALLLAAAAIVIVLAVVLTHRGTGVNPEVVPPPGLSPVGLGQTSAHDYNPFGTGPENRDEVQNVVDGEPSSSWSTEEYYDGTLRKPGGVGAGLYVDAAPSLLARAIELQTNTPGFAVQIYVANQIQLSLPYGDPAPLSARGWQGPVGMSADVHDGERVALNLDGRPYRYYLVWITALAPGMHLASISELTLFK